MRVFVHEDGQGWYPSCEHYLDELAYGTEASPGFRKGAQLPCFKMTAECPGCHQGNGHGSATLSQTEQRNRVVDECKVTQTSSPHQSTNKHGLPTQRRPSNLYQFSASTAQPGSQAASRAKPAECKICSQHTRLCYNCVVYSHKSTNSGQSVAMTKDVCRVPGHDAYLRDNARECRQCHWVGADYDYSPKTHIAGPQLPLTTPITRLQSTPRRCNFPGCSCSLDPWWERCRHCKSESCICTRPRTCHVCGQQSCVCFSIPMSGEQKMSLTDTVKKDIKAADVTNIQAIVAEASKPGVKASPSTKLSETKQPEKKEPETKKPLPPYMLPFPAFTTKKSPSLKLEATKPETKQPKPQQPQRKLPEYKLLGPKIPETKPPLVPQPLFSFPKTDCSDLMPGITNPQATKVEPTRLVLKSPFSIKLQNGKKEDTQLMARKPEEKKIEVSQSALPTSAAQLADPAPVTRPAPVAKPKFRIDCERFLMNYRAGRRKMKSRLENVILANDQKDDIDDWVDLGEELKTDKTKEEHGFTGVALDEGAEYDGFEYIK